MNRGTVYLVGAGPGPSSLLTVRGRELLRSAEVVMYDGLVGREVLRLIPRKARKLRVAKGPTYGGRFPQSRINTLLIREARAGRRVVRLKGGDALLFSRGGEEVEALRAHGIPYEIVPGVTSALAGPAFAGIPLTERGFASSVAIVTGHESAGSHLPPVNWPELGRSVDSLVILMGVAHWGRITNELLRSGRDPDTPVAAIQWATTPRQRTTLFTLAEGTHASIRSRLSSPSVLVVGPTVAKSWRRNWYPKETRWVSARFLEVVERSADGRRSVRSVNDASMRLRNRISGVRPKVATMRRAARTSGRTRPGRRARR